jgi:hypothetical protein
MKFYTHLGEAVQFITAAAWESSENDNQKEILHNHSRQCGPMTLLFSVVCNLSLA